MKNQNLTNTKHISDTWINIRLICHFLPLLSTIGWIVDYTLNPSNFIVNYILFPLMVIGWIAAFIARPRELFAVIRKFISTGWATGWSICPLFPICYATALFIAGVGLIPAFMLVLGAPAAVTLFCFIKDCMEN